MFKLLIIEDDIIDQLALIRLIKKSNLNCAVTTSMKIEDARSKLNEASFDLVICDLNLPDGKAFDLEGLISQQAFILLSGHLEDEIVQKAKNLGAVQVLQKSSELKQLTSIITLIKKMQLKENKSTPIIVSNEPISSKFNIQRLMDTFNHHVESVTGTIEDFLNDRINMHSDIEAARQSEDRESIRFISHKIRSRCVLIGLKEQQRISEYIEINSRSADLENLKNELQKLNDSLQAVYPELEAVVKELKTQVN